MTEEDVENVARALCQEKCARFGEPPCFEIVHACGTPQKWPPPECEPGCTFEARAVLTALEADGWRKVKEGFVVVPTPLLEKWRDAREAIFSTPEGAETKHLWAPLGNAEDALMRFCRAMLAAATSSS